VSSGTGRLVNLLLVGRRPSPIQFGSLREIEVLFAVFAVCPQRLGSLSMAARRVDVVGLPLLGDGH